MSISEEIQAVFDSLPESVSDADRVSRHELRDGTIIWVKQPTTPKSTIWHKIQFWMARLIPLKILRPTVSQGGVAALAAEHEKLAQFAASGIPVVDIMAFDGRALATKNAGQALNRILPAMTDETARLPVLRQAGSALSDLHQAGFCHGRPHVRDMVMGDNGIVFLDFEESPLSVMSLAEAQARDLWLFSMFSARYLDDAALGALVQGLVADAAPDTRASLRVFVGFLRPVAAVLAALRVPGKDVRQAIAATRAWHRILRLSAQGEWRTGRDLNPR